MGHPFAVRRCGMWCHPAPDRRHLNGRWQPSHGAHQLQRAAKHGNAREAAVTPCSADHLVPLRQNGAVRRRRVEMDCRVDLRGRLL